MTKGMCLDGEAQVHVSAAEAEIDQGSWGQMHS